MVPRHLILEDAQFSAKQETYITTSLPSVKEHLRLLSQTCCLVTTCQRSSYNLRCEIVKGMLSKFLIDQSAGVMLVRYLLGPAPPYFVGYPQQKPLNLGKVSLYATQLVLVSYVSAAILLQLSVDLARPRSPIVRLHESS